MAAAGKVTMSIIIIIIILLTIIWTFLLLHESLCCGTIFATNPSVHLTGNISVNEVVIFLIFSIVSLVAGGGGSNGSDRQNATSETKSDTG